MAAANLRFEFPPCPLCPPAASRKEVQLLGQDLNNRREEEEKQKTAIYEKWKSGVKQYDTGYRRLSGSSGRHLKAMWSISVDKSDNGQTKVSVRHWGKCKSNNTFVGAKGTFRLKVGGVVVGSTRADCGARSSDTSSARVYDLTADQVRFLGPSDITVSRDYR